MNGTTRAILAQVESLGYVVKIAPSDGCVDLYAFAKDGGNVQAVQCLDGDSEDDLYRAACTLAQAVGIDLEDG